MKTEPFVDYGPSPERSIASFRTYRHWKTRAHQRLATPMGQPGAITLYRAAPNEHLTAEAKREEFIAGRGVITKWERVRRQNHWFDALYNACAAGHLCRVRLLGETVKRQPVRRPAVINTGIRRPDGRPWIDVDRWREVNRLG